MLSSQLQDPRKTFIRVSKTRTLSKLVQELVMSVVLHRESQSRRIRTRRIKCVVLVTNYVWTISTPTSIYRIAFLSPSALKFSFPKASNLHYTFDHEILGLVLFLGCAGDHFLI